MFFSDNKISKFKMLSISEHEMVHWFCNIIESRREFVNELISFVFLPIFLFKKSDKTTSWWLVI